MYIPECIVTSDGKSTSVYNKKLFAENSSIYWNPLMKQPPVSNYRVVLPEAEMCDAVHKACPLLFHLSTNLLSHSSSTFNRSMTNRSKFKTDESLLLPSIPRFLDCSQYTSGCRQVGLND